MHLFLVANEPPLLIEEFQGERREKLLLQPASAASLTYYDM